MKKNIFITCWSASPQGYNILTRSCKPTSGVVFKWVKSSSGEFDSRLDPDITTWALMSYLAGTKSAWLAGITDIYSAENAEKLIDIFINGIVKR